MKVKVLRGIGLALVAMPEPITTPIGLGILGVSWAISRHEQSQKKAYLRHIVKEYLHTYKPFGYGMNSAVKTSADLPYRSKKKPLFYSGDQSTIASSIPARAARSLQRETAVVFHSFEPGRVSKRFDAGGTRRGFEGYWGRQTKLDLVAIRNSLKMVPCLS